MIVLGFQRICQAVIVAILDQVIVFFEFKDLSLYHFFFYRRHMVDIQFISKGAGHGYRCPGIDRSVATGLLVGALRYMGAHSGNRIAEGRSVLDRQPFDGVGVVACPDLGRIVQHAGVKASASSAAAFDQHVRIASAQFVQHIIKAENIPVCDFSLLICRQKSTVNIGNTAVKIPFQVFDFCRVQNLAHLAEDIVAHILSGEIQN